MQEIWGFVGKEACCWVSPLLASLPSIPAAGEAGRWVGRHASVARTAYLPSTPEGGGGGEEEEWVLG